MMEIPTIISIEANIGAGKSTVLEKLQQILDPTRAICIQEPVELWENFRDNTTEQSILELYYMDPKKYALALQTMIYNTLSGVLETSIEISRNSTNLPMIITERSLQSSNGIFAKMLADSGIMTPIEYQVYDSCVARSPYNLDACIYLRTEPEICYERVLDRNRRGEDRISLEYLQSCHDAHENWISNISQETRVYIIDMGTKSVEKIVAEVLEILAIIARGGGDT